MQTGILLAFLSYLSFSCSDASLKAVGTGLPIFETGFFAALIALVPALFTKRPEDNWRNVLVPNRPWLLLLRMGSGTVGSILGIVAFTSLPLTEVYALIFLQPLFVTALSALVLKEKIGWKRWSAVVAGLVGVVLVVRPGFREIVPGHFAAVGIGFCGAITIIVLRILGPSERRITLIGAALAGTIVVDGILMVPRFVTPDVHLVPILMLAGLGAGCGQLLIVLATRLAPASHVAPTQYSQIVWATVIGAAFFSEFPDVLAMLGMLIVTFSGLFTFSREEKKTRWFRRTPLIRNRG